VGGKVSLAGLSIDPPIRFELLNNLLLRNMLMTEFEISKKGLN
jgi:hypothetical protein